RGLSDLQVLGPDGLIVDDGEVAVRVHQRYQALALCGLARRVDEVAPGLPAVVGVPQNGRGRHRAEEAPHEVHATEERTCRIRVRGQPVLVVEDVTAGVALR